ncbi:MAG: ATP-binding cassette domain-containing protein, partial [Flavobacteriales bacterium]
MSDDKKVIFSMQGITKSYPNKQVLKNIHLSFFYGAKIGILGLNGAGKSTVLKIIAGLDTDFQGNLQWAKGYTVGYLEQEPKLDPEKTVMDIVKEGAAETVEVLEAYEAINQKFCEPEVLENPDAMQKLMDE